jgi:phosphoglycerol transferase MdoB-like AlkP superfamily enzyme
MGRNTSCHQYCENTIDLTYQKFIYLSYKIETKQGYSNLFKNIEIIIAAITVVSVIISILFYVTVLSSDQTNAIYLFDLAITSILTFDFYPRMRKTNNHSKQVYFTAFMRFLLCYR